MHFNKGLVQEVVCSNDIPFLRHFDGTGTFTHLHIFSEVNFHSEPCDVLKNFFYVCGGGVHTIIVYREMTALKMDELYRQLIQLSSQLKG